MILLISFSQTPEFEYFQKEKETLQNNTDYSNMLNNSEFKRRLSVRVENDSFISWQIFKSHISKSVIQAIIKICLEINQTNSQLDSLIVGDFWPNNRLSYFDQVDLADWGKDNLIDDASLDEFNQINRKRDISTTSVNSNILSIEERDSKNPFLAHKNTTSNNNNNTKFFQSIKERSLESESIEKFFKINPQSIDKYLLMLFCSHIDILMILIGPENSLEYIVPLFFSIMHTNGIYHSNFENVELDNPMVQLL